MATVMPQDPFDVEENATQMHDALKGVGILGVDHDKVIDILVTMVNAQRLELKDHYLKVLHLHDEFRMHLVSQLEDTCRALIDPLPLFDAKELHGAFQQLIGGDDLTMVEIICARTADELEAIKVAYEEEFGHSIIDRIQTETTVHFERILTAQLSGERDQSSEIDDDLAHEDAQKMYDAGEGMWGTDTSEFIRILSVRSYNQLRQTFVYYEDLAGKSMEETIRDEMILHLQEACVSLVEYIKNPVNYFATRIYDGIRGLITSKNTLRRVIVHRSESDMYHVKAHYEEKYEASLKDEIENHVHFDFKKILIRLIGEEY